jgi:hypothetical protein
MVHKDRVDNALPVRAHRQKLLELEPELSRFLSLHLHDKKVNGPVSRELEYEQTSRLRPRLKSKRLPIQGQSFKKDERTISREISYLKLSFIFLHLK